MFNVKDRKGMTGLETAIILVAFVITAAAFSFVIINMGFLTSQKAQSVISTGMTEASSSMLIDSGVVAQFDNVTLGDQDLIYLSELQFYIKLSQGHEPIDVDDSKMVATYTSSRCHGELYNTNGTIMTVYIINGDADTLLEPGEKFKVVIDFTELPKNKVSPIQATHKPLYAKPYETFRVELRPSAGAVLAIERVIPAVYNTMMTLE